MSNQNKSTDEVSIIFAQQAEAVVNNDAYIFAITAMKGELFAKLAISPILGDNDGILEMVRELQVVTKFEKQFEKIIQGGKVGEANLKAIETNHKRHKR